MRPLSSSSLSAIEGANHAPALAVGLPAVGLPAVGLPAMGLPSASMRVKSEPPQLLSSNTPEGVQRGHACGGQLQRGETYPQSTASIWPQLPGAKIGTSFGVRAVLLFIDFI